MVSLSSERRQTVKDCILTAIRDTLREEIAVLPTKSPCSRFICITEVISALSSLFKSAVREVSEEWNSANGDALMSLPTELTLECLRLLDPRDRMTVSHVSRRWRQTALSDCRLWNSYTASYVPRDDPSSVVEGITTMLARSHPLPFHFSSFTWPNALPDELFDVLCRNMDRMATLRIDYGLTRLSQLDAPILTHLTYTYPILWRATPELPAEWGARHAPRLEFLEVDNIRLPADLQPMPSLRTFRARVPDDVDGSLLAAFPNLTHITLCGVTQASFQMLNWQFLSPRTTVLTFDDISEPVIDYAPLLQVCRERRILELSIDAAATFSDVVEVFVQQSSDLRALEIILFRIYLRDSTRSMKWSIQCRNPIQLMDEAAHCVPQLRSFSALTLSLPDFLDLHQLQSWDRQLPSLHSLTLSIPGALEVSAAQRAIDYTQAPSAGRGIHLPALESLELRSGVADDTHFASWLRSAETPVLLSTILCNSRRPLASIRVQAAYPGSFWDLSRQDVAPFFPLAERIVVLDVETDDQQQVKIFVEAQQSADRSD